MNRMIRRFAIPVTALLSTSAIVFVMSIVLNASTSTSVTSESTAIPLPVQEALSVVAASRGAGPLTVDPNGGSVVGGVWTATTTGQSVGVSQHWSLRASDNSGVIVLGIIVMSNGTEAVNGWIPGASQAGSWVFNTANASPAATFHVTVPGTMQTISQPSR
jgi:hypothetical protein